MDPKTFLKLAVVVIATDIFPKYIYIGVLKKKNMTGRGCELYVFIFT